MHFDGIWRDLVIQAEDVRQQQFLRNHLAHARAQACEHRPLASSQVQQTSSNLRGAARPVEP